MTTVNRCSVRLLIMLADGAAGDPISVSGFVLCIAFCKSSIA